MSIPDLLPKLHMAAGRLLQWQDTVTHAGCSAMGNAGQESHMSAGGRDLTGMKGREPPSCQASRQGDLDPGRLSGPREGFGVSPVLSCVKMPPPLPLLLPLPSCLAFPSMPGVFSLPQSFAYSCFFCFSHLSSLKWPLWPICAFPLHLSGLCFC